MNFQVKSTTKASSTWKRIGSKNLVTKLDTVSVKKVAKKKRVLYEDNGFDLSYNLAAALNTEDKENTGPNDAFDVLDFVSSYAISCS